MVSKRENEKSVDVPVAERKEEASSGLEKKWYAVHVLSGHEQKVKAYLESEIRKQGLQDRFGEILVPAEQITEMREGKKRTRTRIFFPGYILLEMHLDKETQHLVQNVPGVTNFVGTKDRPVPLQPHEVERILGRVDRTRERGTTAIPFRVGDPVRVVDGPFTDFTGYVEEINEEKNKVKVMVSIFGRATPVELDFLQVELEK